LLQSRRSQHFKTIEDFLQTEFPKSNNPLSPTLDTEITEIKWNGSTISIPNKIRTVRDLTDLLSKENVENIFISNRDVRLHKIKPKHDDLIRKSTYSIEYVHSKVKDVLFEKDKRKRCFPCLTIEFLWLFGYVCRNK
jgi:methionyl-tRNA formyltransferase